MHSLQTIQAMNAATERPLSAALGHLRIAHDLYDDYIADDANTSHRTVARSLLRSLIEVADVLDRENDSALLMLIGETVELIETVASELGEDLRSAEAT